MTMAQRLAAIDAEVNAILDQYPPGNMLDVRRPSLRVTRPIMGKRLA